MCQTSGECQSVRVTVSNCVDVRAGKSNLFASVLPYVCSSTDSGVDT